MIAVASPLSKIYSEKILQQEREVTRLAEKLNDAREALREMKRKENAKVVFPMKPDEEERK